MFDLFRAAGGIVLRCRNIDATKRWLVEAFDCRQVPVPKDWEDTEPSDVALKLPGDQEPSVLLYCRGDSQEAEMKSPTTTVPIIFCRNLKKAQEVLIHRGITAGPIQDGGDTQFFEIRDLEGNVIEICTEP
jgi:hypothetical protein